MSFAGEQESQRLTSGSLGLGIEGAAAARSGSTLSAGHVANVGSPDIERDTIQVKMACSRVRKLVTSD